MPEKLYRVRAGDGIVIPLPDGIAVDTNTRVLTQEDIVNVRDERFTRRCIANGDFVVVDEGKPVVTQKADDEVITSAERWSRPEAITADEMKPPDRPRRGRE